jgi:DNA polymerase III epsilon subunit-like protein
MQEENTNKRFAVVHLETTGTTARSKILEISIILLEEDYDEMIVVDSYNAWYES